MTRASKPAAIPNSARKQAVIYACVSSKEQEKNGFSIPAQLKILKEYVAAQGFAVAQEYVDVETAKQTGRTAFGEMVGYLKEHPAIRVMLVEKTDRLYRTLRDWVTVDELDVEIHFPNEGVVLSRESRSSEKFMNGINVLMAKAKRQGPDPLARPANHDASGGVQHFPRSSHGLCGWGIGRYLSPPPSGVMILAGLSTRCNGSLFLIRGRLVKWSLSKVLQHKIGSGATSSRDPSESLPLPSGSSSECTDSIILPHIGFRPHSGYS
jgi:hypothetical protein